MQVDWRAWEWCDLQRQDNVLRLGIPRKDILCLRG